MRRILLAILAGMISFTSAGQNELAKQDTGIIETIFDARTFPCFDLQESGRPRQSRYVIDSESEYSGYKERFGERCHFPDIDFLKHVLLGIYGGGNNYCNAEHRLSVEDDRVRKRYVYTLTVTEHGFCKMAVRWHWYWVLVPRLPGSYSVQSKVYRVRDRAPSVKKL